MIFEEIWEQLDRRHFNLLREDAKNQEIQSIRLINPEIREWSSDILYICYDEHMKFNLPENQYVTVIFYKRDFITAESKGNFICMYGSMHIWEVVITFQHLFTDSTKILTKIQLIQKALISDNGLSYFVREVARTLGVSLFVFNNSGICQARAFKGDLAKEREKPVENILSCFIEQYGAGLPVMPFLQYPFIIYNSELHMNMLMCGICIQNVWIAYMIMLEDGNSLLDIENECLQLVPGLISQELQKASFFKQNKGNFKAGFLLELILDERQNMQMLNRKLKQLKFELKEKFYVILIRYQQEFEKDITVLADYFQPILTGNIYTIYQNQLVVLLNRHMHEDMGEYVFSSLKRGGNAYKLAIGISREFYDVALTRRFYKQAERSIEYGLGIPNARSQKPLYFYHDHMLIEMLEICRSQENIMDFCHPNILRLIDYDQQNHTELTNTFYEWLEHKCNAQKTADALFIHKNTLIYRMERVKSIMENQLDTSWDLFNFYLSFRIIMFNGMFLPNRAKTDLDVAD